MIVHLGPAALPVTYRHGGAIQRRILEIAKQQAARGHRVAIYSADRETKREELSGVEIRSLACAGSGFYRDFLYLRGALADLRDREGVEILHFHGLPEGAALAGGITRKKFLSYDYFTFRRGKKTPLYWWYRKSLRRFSCLLPVSEHCWDGSRDYWALGDVAARILHNGVNTDHFRPDPMNGLAKKRSLGMDAERIILYVGRVCEQKGSDVLIRAYLRLKQEYPDCRLVVAGPADRFGQKRGNELTQRIRECGGLYLGAVEEAELNAIYNMADIFVMPTREVEMFGMAAVEAQACGKPVIASRHGGLPEVISERSGLFFPNGDDAALADQLLLLLRDQDLRRTLAEAARPSAARFAWPKIVDQLDQIYSQG